MPDLDVLVVGAHPDDAEIGCAATMARCKRDGMRVGIVDCSNGEPTPFGTVEKRLGEARRAADLLGVDTRVTLDMPNRSIQNTIENRIKLSDAFRELRPRIVITHPASDWHPDHVAVHQLVNAAKFHAKLVKTESTLPPFYPSRVFYFDHAHLKEQRRLDFLIDVSDTIEDKIRALQCYASQFIENKKNERIFDYVRERAGFLGYQAGVRYAEGFTSPEYVMIKDLSSIV